MIVIVLIIIIIMIIILMINDNDNSDAVFVIIIIVIVIAPPLLPRRRGAPACAGTTLTRCSQGAPGQKVSAPAKRVLSPTGT